MSLIPPNTSELSLQTAHSFHSSHFPAINTFHYPRTLSRTLSHDSFFEVHLTPSASPPLFKRFSVLLFNIQKNDAFASHQKIKKIADETNSLMNAIFNLSYKQDCSLELLAIHEIASEFIKSTPITRKIWKHLNQRVQNLFHTLVPYALPPTEKGKLVPPFSQAHKIPLGSHIFKMSDNFLFKLDFEATTSNSLFFSTSNQPKLKLYVTGPSEYYNSPPFQTAIRKIPKGIDDFFDAASVKKNVDLSKFSFRQNASQHFHQLLIMKKHYQCLIQESLGVPVSLPLSIGKSGEWFLTWDETTYRLKDSFQDAGAIQNIPFYAEKIAQFFLIEELTGLYLIGDHDTPLHSNASLFYVQGQNLFCHIPKKHFTFIKYETNNEAIASRHQKIRAHLRCLYLPFSQTLVNQVDTQLLEKKIQTAVQGHLAFFLKAAVEQKLLTFENLLDFSEEAVACLQALKGIPPFFNPEEVPWEKLKTLENFILFAKLKKELLNYPQTHISIFDSANQDRAEASISFKEIHKIKFYHLACALFFSLPRKKSGEENPNPLHFHVKIEQSIHNDFQIRKNMNQIVLTLFLQDFLEKENQSIITFFEDLINEMNQKIERDFIFTQLPLDGHLSWQDYFHHVVWQPLFEEITPLIHHNRTLNLEIDIFDKILLLRAAFHVGHDLKAVEEELEIVLHRHLLSREQSKRETRVKEAIKQVLPQLH